MYIGRLLKCRYLTYLQKCLVLFLIHIIIGLKHSDLSKEGSYGIVFFLLIDGYIPEGEWVNKNIYNKHVLKPLTQESVYKMIIEMRRAELVHWLSILPVIVFVKAPKCIKTINILYALLANVPIILTQRYNRPRLERYYQLKYKRDIDDGE